MCCFFRYYFPTYENDALLTALSDSEGESEGPNPSSEVPVIAEDISNLKVIKQTSVLNKLLKDRGGSNWRRGTPRELCSNYVSIALCKNKYVESNDVTIRVGLQYIDSAHIVKKQSNKLYLPMSWLTGQFSSVLAL